MERTYVFNGDGGGCNSCGSKLDITALLPGLFGGGRNSLDPNLLLLLNNGYNNQGMWGGAGMWWIWILLFFGLGRNGWGGFGGNGGCNTCNALPWALNGDAGRNTVMVISLTSTPAEFLNSWLHEMRHLSRHIELTCGISPYGEEAAYLAGDIGHRMFPVAKNFICEHCRKELNI